MSKFHVTKEMKDLIRVAAILPSAEAIVQGVIDKRTNDKSREYPFDEINISSYGSNVCIQDIEDIKALRDFLSAYLEQHEVLSR